MVKVIAIADLHIKRTPGVCWGWNKARYKRFIDDLISTCVERNAILAIAGDSLDSTAPKKEELQLFMYLLHELHKNNVVTLLVSGNHCTVKKGSSILDFLEVSQFPNVYYRRNYSQDNVTFHLCNHDSLDDYEVNLQEGKNILVSHFRCNYNKFVTEEIPVAEFTKPYDLCIVGDIHDSYQEGNLWYTNNPINKEFDTDPTCGYLEISIGNEITVDRVTTNYPRLLGRKVKASEFSSLQFTKQDFYKVEVEGSPEELKLIKEWPSNVILVKVPVVTSSLFIPEVDDVKDTEGSDVGLEEYMKAMGYSDELIVDMMKELRRPL